MIARTVAVLLATAVVGLGCKSRVEKSEPAPSVEEDKSAGTDEKSDEGWTPKPVGGGPTEPIEPTPTPAPAPAAKPKPAKPAPSAKPSAVPSAAPSATPSAAPSASAPWQWPQSIPTWPWGTTPDAGPKTSPSTAPSANPPVIPWPWPQQQ